MSDLRNRVARAIAYSGDIREKREWSELLPETRSHYRKQADAALAEMDDNRDGYLGLYTGPIEVGMSFIWEPNKPHARQVFIVTRIEEREHDERRIFSGDTEWNDESRFREAVVALIEPAPVSVQPRASVSPDHSWEPVNPSAARTGEELRRAIAEGKDDE